MSDGCGKTVCFTDVYPQFFHKMWIILRKPEGYAQVEISLDLRDFL